MEFIKSFDDGWEVRDVFVDVSKSFDKICHKSALLKLKQNGISINLIKISNDFLANRYHGVV